MYQHTKKLFLLLLAVLGMHQAMAQSPTITSQPSNQSGCAGANVSFFVTANNATGYQWQVNQGTGFLPISNGGIYAGATTANLTISGISIPMSGYSYRCVVTGLTPPSVTSNAATLTVSVPTITTQPVNTSACAGASANFSLTATGAGLTYQWMENQGAGFVALSNSAIYAGVNTPSLTVSGTSVAMNGYTYECIVSGTCNPPTTSSVATLSISASPAVITSPAPVTICEGSNTSFAVAATGNGLTYQWMVNQGAGFIAILDGALYNGATTASLNITGATAAMSGYSYECVVSGTCTPAVISNAALLTVNAAPLISTQPAANTVCAGANATFFVSAVGAPSYQWQENQGAGFVNISNGGMYSGANTATLTLTGVTAAMSGYTYQCVLSNASCATTTIAVGLTVNVAPAITGQPAAASVCVGANTTFGVTATGAGLTYQWQLSTGGPFANVTNGGVYSGATTPTLTIAGAAAGMNGTVYNCVVTGTCSPAVTSNNATLTVKALPVITTQPTNPAAVCAGGNMNIALIATAPVTYQWQVNQGAGFVNVINGGNYAGATTATLAITGATAAFNGNQYQCIVSNAGGCSVNSNTVTTTVNSSPAVTTPPAATAICAGGIGTMSVVATGAGLTYQWQAFIAGLWTNMTNGTLLGTTVSGATLPTVTFTNAAAAINNTNIRVIVSGTCVPPATSTPALLTINALPAITAQPVNRTVCASAATTFGVTATGTGLTYQWQENQGAGFVNLVDGGIYSNSSTATLNISAVTPAMSGYTYQCIVSGTCSPAVTSNIASLTVNPATTVTGNPTPVTMCAPANTTFGVTATGTGALTYQWQVSTNGGATFNNLTNAGVYSNVTTATMTITGGTVALNGNLYQCVVTSPTCGSATSASAMLTVNAATAITVQPTPATICAGNNTSFTVTAAGSGLTYQWQINTGSGFLPLQDTGIYSGSLTNSLTLTNVSAALSGYTYNCIVSGTCAPLTITSNNVALTVNTAPFITSDPTNVFACVGTNITFATTAVGTALTYQWQLSTNGGVTWNNLANGAGYANVTTATMSFTGVTAGMTGYEYRVIVSGTCTPKDTGAIATLTINSANPVVTTQPVSVNTCAGNNVTFSAVAGTGNLNYQWQVSTNAGVTWANVPVGAPYSGGTTNTLTITAVPASYGTYQYRLTVRSVCPPFTVTNSNAAILTIETPTITGQPTSTTVCVGTSATFTVAASGGFLSYQWQADSNASGNFFNLTDTGVISGSQNGILTISSVNDSLNGYTFHCVVAGLCSTNATSNNVILTVNDISTWTGALSNLWSNPGNWSCNALPTQYTNVIIPAAAANQPVVDITTAIAHDVTVNAGASLISQAGSILTVKGSILPSPAAIFNPVLGTVIFSGKGLQFVPSANYLDLQMDNTGQKKLTGSITVADKLILLQGLVLMGNNNLTLGPNATISNGGPVSYLVTNGSGMIVDQNIGIGGKVQFEKLPVGPSVVSYNPISIHNTGVADAFKIMVLDSIYYHYFGIAPTSIAMTTGAVNRTWIVEETVPGGSIATIKVQWNAADELPGFDRNISYLSQYTNPNWTLDTGGIPVGFNPFTDTLSAVTNFSQYNVAFGVINGMPPFNTVGSVSKQGGIVVFPNPVSGDQIFVRFTNTTSDVHVRITDILGKVWTVTDANPANYTYGTIPMNVSNLPAGLYILQVIDSSNNTVESVKFNKE